MSEAAGSVDDGIPAELADIITHDVKRIFKYFWKDYNFISDQELVESLSSKKHHSLDEALLDYKAITLPAQMEIRFQSGSALRIRDLHTLFQTHCPDLTPPEGADSMDLYLDPILRSTMKRYGKIHKSSLPSDTLNEQMQHFMEHMQLETMKRLSILELQMQELCASVAGFSSHIVQGQSPSKTDSISASVLRRGSAIPEQVQTVTLSAVIHGIKNLPKMDAFRGCDALCKIFLEGAPSLFHTEIRRGTQQGDLEWEPSQFESFKWELLASPEHLRPARKLVVMVYDRHHSKDNLVGCVTVCLADLLRSGVFHGWRPIARPPNAPSVDFFVRKPLVGEVLLTVVLEGEGLMSVLKRAEERGYEEIRSTTNALPHRLSNITAALGFSVATPPSADHKASPPPTCSRPSSPSVSSSGD